MEKSWSYRIKWKLFSFKIRKELKYKDLQAKFDEVNESFSNYVNQERESLLSKIPETKREKFEKVDDLSLLRDIVSEFDSKSGVNVGQVENKVSVDKFKGNPFNDLADEKHGPVPDEEKWYLMI